MVSVLNRDSMVWTLSFISAVLIFIIAHTGLVPMEWHNTVQDIATVLGFISGKLGMSMLPNSQSIDNDIKPTSLVGKNPIE